MRVLRPTLRSTAVAVACLAAIPAPAQQFVEAGESYLPLHEESTWEVAYGDVDSDGDQDLVAGNIGQSRLYLNDGNGLFTDATQQLPPGASYDTRSVALGDLDRDGDLDLVLAVGQGPLTNRVYQNDGAGHFTDVTAAALPLRFEFTNDLALGDVDGDGDLDLVTGNQSGGGGGTDFLYLNDGSGVFTDARAAFTNVLVDVIRR